MCYNDENIGKEGVTLMLEYNEHVVKRITTAGSANIVIGVLFIVIGITLGTLSIIYGGRMLSTRKHLID